MPFKKNLFKIVFYLDKNIKFINKNIMYTFWDFFINLLTNLN